MTSNEGCQSQRLEVQRVASKLPRCLRSVELIASLPGQAPSSSAPGLAGEPRFNSTMPTIIHFNFLVFATKVAHVSLLASNVLASFES